MTRPSACSHGIALDEACGACGRVAAPSEHEIEWFTTPDRLMAIAERPDVWPWLELALRDLEREWKEGRGLSSKYRLDKDKRRQVGIHGNAED